VPDEAVAEDDGVLSVVAVKERTELECVIWTAEPKEVDSICRLLL
jgi:carotenoid cleavage dioxygenase-like enzyme